MVTNINLRSSRNLHRLNPLGRTLYLGHRVISVIENNTDTGRCKRSVDALAKATAYSQSPYMKSTLEKSNDYCLAFNNARLFGVGGIIVLFYLHPPLLVGTLIHEGFYWFLTGNHK
jgi:hypothetical protein